MGAALLPGSRQVVLAGAIHGSSRPVAWYGIATILDAWWPVALAAGRDALRTTGDPPRGQRAAVRPGVPR